MLSRLGNQGHWHTFLWRQKLKSLIYVHQRRSFTMTTRINSANLSPVTGAPRSAKPPASTTTDSPYHFYQNKVLEPYLRQTIHANTLRQYITFGRQMTSARLIKSANWVRHELMIRLAHRIRDFQQLPFIVGANPNIEWAYRLYWGAFEALRTTPTIKTTEDNATFCALLEDLLEDGQEVVPQMILGISECASHYKPQDRVLDHFLNRMMQAGISRRLLAEQHVALTKSCSGSASDRQALDSMAHQYSDVDHPQTRSKYGNQVGVFNTECSTRVMLDHIRLLLANKHSSSSTNLPPVDIQIYEHDDITLAYIPDQLEQILYELMHNATQYTLRQYKKGDTDNDQQTDMPPIRVTVSANKTDVFFRVSDQAGGILLPKYQRLWSCQERANHGDFADLQHIPKMPVTLTERIKRQQTINDPNQPGKVATSDHPEVRGLGIGLIMSRVYAEYWGGELQVMSMDGYGTDAYVRIPRNGSTAENLGIINTPLMEQTHGRHHHLALKKNPVINQTVPADKPISRMIMHSDIFHNQKGWLPSTVVPS